MARGSVARCGVSGSGIASRELRDGRDAKAGRYASLILRSPPPRSYLRQGSIGGRGVTVEGGHEISDRKGAVQRIGICDSRRRRGVEQHNRREGYGNNSL